MFFSLTMRFIINYQRVSLMCGKGKLPVKNLFTATLLIMTADALKKAENVVY